MGRSTAFVVAALAILTGTALTAGATLQRPDDGLVLAVGAHRVEIDSSDYVRVDRVDRVALARIVKRQVPRHVVVRRGNARIVRRRDLAGAVRRAASLGADGGVVRIDSRPISAVVSAPVVAQSQRNTCESAALQVLAATLDRRLDQRVIQRAFPVSGPLDPVPGPTGDMWGDPDKGYVGRPDGGGTRGGFGIYPRPVLRTAQRLGLALDDMSGASPAALYGRLLSGRAVMAWVGLSDGPYGTWTSPAGRRVRVNFGEHTLVVHGLRADGLLLISNPLFGTRELWTKAEFEARWRLLGHRALSSR